MTNLVVTKTANPFMKYRDTPISFRKMPTLYLELLENKDKIKQKLVNKFHVPKAGPSIGNSVTSEGKNRSPVPAVVDNILNSPCESPRKKSFAENSVISMSSYNNETKTRAGAAIGGAAASEVRSHDAFDSKPYNDNHNDKPQNDVTKSHNENGATAAATGDSNKTHDTDKVDGEKSGEAAVASDHEDPPSLQDLERKGHFRRSKFIPREEIDEDEDDLKREMLFKLDSLRRSYPHLNIPEMSMYSDSKSIRRTLDSYVKQIYAEGKAEDYQKYLIVGCMVLEWLLSTFLKLPMEGFTQQQIMNIKSYEKLLIELGEKQYVPQDSQWPVEIRLMIMILINGVIFLISKLLFDPSNVMNILNSLGSKSSFGKVPGMGSGSGPEKRRMREPEF